MSGPQNLIRNEISAEINEVIAVLKRTVIAPSPCLDSPCLLTCWSQKDNRELNYGRRRLLQEFRQNNSSNEYRQRLCTIRMYVCMVPCPDNDDQM